MSGRFKCHPMGWLVILLPFVTYFPVSYGEAVIEEIVVTAQKREQNLQEVPISVSAFSQNFLEETGVDDIYDLTFYTPGLVVESGSNPTYAQISLRGVGTSGANLGLESSVGVYIDGVFRPRQSSAIQSLYDIERVEVLRGPQGTLFGRNTASGAVQYISVAPQNEFGGYLNADAGEFGFLNLEGAINIPLVDEVLAARISGSWFERDGYVDNLTTGSEINDRDRYSVRGQLLYTPNDTVSLRIIAEYSLQDEACCAATNVFDGPTDSAANFFESIGAIAATGGSAPPLPGIPAFLPIDITLGLLASDDPFFGDPTFTSRFPNGPNQVLADRFDDFEVGQTYDPFARIEEQGISAELTWDFSDNVTFTSITAYRDYEAQNDVDGDFAPVDSLNPADNDTEITTFSQEFRLSGSLNDKTEFVVGAYYFKQDLDDQTELGWGPDGNGQGGGFLPSAGFVSLGAVVGVPGAASQIGIEPTALPAALAFGDFFAALFTPGLSVAPATIDAFVAYCQSQLNDTYDPTCALPTFPNRSFAIDDVKLEQTSWAVFGQLDYSITDDLVATIGLRYNDEEKELDERFTQFNPDNANIGVDPALAVATFSFFTPFSNILPDRTGEKFEDETVTGTAKLTYFWNEDLMTYVSYGRGYKAGGINVDRIPLTPATQAARANELFVQPAATITTPGELQGPLTFDPEVATSWEVGLKGTFFDGRLRTNVAVFTSEFEDFQAESFIGDGFVLANAGKLTSDGVEIDFIARPTEWLTLSGAGAWIDAEYDSFTAAPCISTPYIGTPDGVTTTDPGAAAGGVQILANRPFAGLSTFCDKSGEQVPTTPEFSVTGTVRIEGHVFDNILGYFQVDARWSDETQHGQDADPNQVTDSYTLVNMRAGLSIEDGKYDVSVWGRNITDEVYAIGIFDAVGRDGSLTGYHSDPRVWGVSLRARF